ncbi:hypothetical protein Q5752_006853 [Cryptotrichosporon argae]
MSRPPKGRPTARTPFPVSPLDPDHDPPASQEPVSPLSSSDGEAGAAANTPNTSDEEAETRVTSARRQRTEQGQEPPDEAADDGASAASGGDDTPATPVEGREAERDRARTGPGGRAGTAKPASTKAPPRQSRFKEVLSESGESDTDAGLPTPSSSGDGPHATAERDAPPEASTSGRGAGSSSAKRRAADRGGDGGRERPPVRQRKRGPPRAGAPRNGERERKHANDAHADDDVHACCASCVCAPCPSCRPCVACARAVGRWRLWGAVRRHAVFVLALALGAACVGVGLSGPVVGYYFCSVGGGDVGGTGYCDGDSAQCAVFSFDQSAPASGYPWLAVYILQVVLLIYAGAGAVFLLVLAALFLRLLCCPTSSLSAVCCAEPRDIESGASRPRAGADTATANGAAKTRTLDAFDEATAWMLVLVLALSVALMVLFSAFDAEPAGGEELWEASLVLVLATIVAKAVYRQENMTVFRAKRRRYADQMSDTVGRAKRAGRDAGDRLRGRDRSTPGARR